MASVHLGEVADQARRSGDGPAQARSEKRRQGCHHVQKLREWIITDLALQLGGYVSVPSILIKPRIPSPISWSILNPRPCLSVLDAPVWRRLRDAVPGEHDQDWFLFSWQ